jgi:hypothetical protein
MLARTARALAKGGHAILSITASSVSNVSPPSTSALMKKAREVGLHVIRQVEQGTLFGDLEMIDEVGLFVRRVGSHVLTAADVHQVEPDAEGTCT